MNDSQELRGMLNKIIFRSEETGFTICTIQVTSKETITARGVIPNITVGETVSCTGIWVNHSKFGRQFQIESCNTELPVTALGIRNYLSSGLIKGIGKSLAERLVNRFGTQTLEIIDKTPEKLLQVDGIGEKRIELIAKAWRDQKEISRVMVFLQEKEISVDFATKIFKTYGQESIAKIMENPYRLAEDIWGVGFKSSDKIANKLGFQKESPLRIRAGLVHTITEALNGGNLYIEFNELLAKTKTTLELNEEEGTQLFKSCIGELYKDDKIKLLTFNEKHYITLPQYYFSEKGIATKLLRFQTLHSTKTINFDLEDIYQKVRQPDSRGMTLNEDQQRGIMMCIQNKFSIITGGPGTGKTTLIKKLLEILEGTRCSVRLAAPTGRAAKRMYEGTGKNSETIHRLLEFNPATMGFTKNETNAIDCDFLIVDEASMIDVFLMHSLFKALPDRAHLILLGDVDQLPSVGAGNVLNDMIASEKIAVVALKEIFRQAQDSLIIVNAHKINNGEFPVSHVEGSKNDFVFIKESKPEDFIARLPALLSSIKNKRGINYEDILVLCPMNRGLVGTQRINHELQSFLNPHTPGKETVMRFGTAYHVGDRVMQIKNNYTKFVFNGDMGYITAVDMSEQAISIQFGERVLPYDFSELNEIVLSYAISIHKSQGSEFKAIIVPVFMQHFVMLQRNLLYTALTRAKQFCIFVGEPKALIMGIKNNKSIARTTFLKQFLTSDLQAR